MIELLELLKLNVDTIVLIIGSVCMVILIMKWHTDKTSPFDVRSALMTDDMTRFSLSKFGQFLAMITSTWIVIHQTRANNLTEWLFTGYMLAWAGANALNKYLETKIKKE